jgi:hypothetical protein
MITKISYKITLLALLLSGCANQHHISSAIDSNSTLSILDKIEETKKNFLSEIGQDIFQIKQTKNSNNNNDLTNNKEHSDLGLYKVLQNEYR